MTQELSGVTVVVFIAAGVLTMFLLFIFAKRSIMRFTLRSRRGPHVPIGHDAKKVKNDAFLGKFRLWLFLQTVRVDYYRVDYSHCYLFFSHSKRRLNEE